MEVVIFISILKTAKIITRKQIGIRLARTLAIIARMFVVIKKKVKKIRIAEKISDRRSDLVTLELIYSKKRNSLYMPYLNYGSYFLKSSASFPVTVLISSWFLSLILIRYFSLSSETNGFPCLGKRTVETPNIMFCF